MKLPEGFRKLTAHQRRESLMRLPCVTEEELSATLCNPEALELSDAMVESSVGSIPVPLGVVTEMVVDGDHVLVPMAVEEPSVIAAANYASKIIAAAGGFSTWATDPIMTVQVFLERCRDQCETDVIAAEDDIRSVLRPRLASMERRGGGYRGIDVA